MQISLSYEEVQQHKDHKCSWQEIVPGHLRLICECSAVLGDIVTEYTENPAWNIGDKVKHPYKNMVSEITEVVRSKRTGKWLYRVYFNHEMNFYWYVDELRSA